jgi:hypothetical protein
MHRVLVTLKALVREPATSRGRRRKSRRAQKSKTRAAAHQVLAFEPSCMEGVYGITHPRGVALLPQPHGVEGFVSGR